MRLRQRYQPVQALAPNRSDHPLAERIGLRAVRRRLEHGQAEIPDRFVQASREDAVPVVNQVLTGLVESNDCKPASKLDQMEVRTISWTT